MLMQIRLEKDSFDVKKIKLDCTLVDVFVFLTLFTLNELRAFPSRVYQQEWKGDGQHADQADQHHNVWLPLCVFVGSHG